jgi:hypothetical protein
MSTFVENQTSYETPPTDRGTSVMDAIRHVTRALESTNDADDQSIKRPRDLKLTTDQLTQLLTACSTPAAPVTTPDNSSTLVVSVSSKLPAYVNNAKNEAICCRPIVPLYDGTEADLMPFLLCLDIRRQDEGWAPATYITIGSKRYDLTLEFLQVTEEDVLANAKLRWNVPTVLEDKHIIGHDTCNARLLANCLLVSISTDFCP